MLYHGSKNDFDEFKVSRFENISHGRDSGIGVYCTRDIDFAKGYCTGENATLYTINDEFLNGTHMLSNDEITLTKDELNDILRDISLYEIENVGCCDFISSYLGCFIEELDYDRLNETVDMLLENNESDLDIFNELYIICDEDIVLDSFEKQNIVAGINQERGEIVVFNPKNIEIINKEKMNLDYDNEYEEDDYDM